MDSTVPSSKYKQNIYKFYMLYFIMGIHTVRGVYIPYMMDWGGLSFFEIMILQSYFMFVIFILEIPSGAIADRIGRNIALMLSALSVACAAFFYSAAPIFFLFFVGETFWAFSIALFSGTEEAFLFNTLKTMDQEKKLPTILGRNQTIKLIALTISAPLGSIIAQYISLQFTMTCLGLIYLGAFLVSLTLKEPKIEGEKQAQHYLTIIRVGFRELKKNSVLKRLCFERIIISYLTFFLFWTYQVYLGEVNIPILWFGFVAAAMNIVNMGFTILIPWMLKRVKNKLRFLIAVDTIIGLSFILLGFATFPFLGILLLLLIRGFGNSRNLIFVNGINRQIESENRATVLSTVNMFGSFLMSIAFPFIGLIVELNPFLVFSIIGIVILFFTVVKRIKKEDL